MSEYKDQFRTEAVRGRSAETLDAFDLRNLRYTVRDFYEKPEDWKGELIDGVFYDLSSPTIVHQILNFLIARQLMDYVEKNHRNCIVLPLPQDTQLDCDDYTMVEPDLSVVCDRSKLRKRKVFGAPDFVVEILSPPTAFRDRFLKLLKYMEAGVREYWIVDPDTRTIMVYAREVPIVPMTYTFDDKVPVSIWKEDFQVDFSLITKGLELYTMLPDGT